MNNIVIGIVGREEEINHTKFMAITKNNMKYLDGKCSYIGLITYNNDFDINTVNLCDGIIIQGGNKIYPYHFKILEYALKNNIPLLGICMGHQVIGLYSVGSKNEDDLIRVDNHYSLRDTHNIMIKKDTLLYNLFGKIMDVNTRHLYKLEEVKKPFIISALSNDNVIEGIEYIDNKHFIVGVQFHPEDMKNTEALYNYFLKEVIKRKK